MFGVDMEEAIFSLAILHCSALSEIMLYHHILDGHKDYEYIEPKHYVTCLQVRKCHGKNVTDALCPLCTLALKTFKKNSDVRGRTNFWTNFLTNVRFQASQLLREDKEKKAQKSDTSEAYDNALVNLPPVPPRPPRQNNMRRWWCPCYFAMSKVKTTLIH